MKNLTVFLSLLCLTAALAVPAGALEYDIDAPGSPEYAKSTSVEPVITADRGERPNEDLSKDTALMPPDIGGGAVLEYNFPSACPATGYTAVTEDLYYEDGSLGRLAIPSLGVNVKVVQGTDSAALAKGAGHFEDSSVWNANVCLAGHNRGVNCYFGSIHTLNEGDAIIYTTKLGTRTYSVVSVRKVSEMDYSATAPTGDDRITLITCVRSQPAYRWCVTATAVR